MAAHTEAVSTAGEIKVVYELASLPTEQHRAGLGSLLFLLDLLSERNLFSRQSYTATDERLSLCLTPSVLTALLSLLYAGVEATRVSANPPQSGDYEPIMVEEDHGKTSLKYQYRARRPAGEWLCEHGYDDQALALWQDSVWSTLRDKPAARLIYSRPVDEVGDELWTALKKVVDGKAATLGISGALYIGGRSRSAEDVPFADAPERIFLLHFAHALARPFRLFGLDRAGRPDPQGTVWAFPVPRRLLAYIEEMKSYLASPLHGRHGVSLPEEAGLAFLDAAAHTGTGAAGVAGAFCAHLDKQGHNVNLLATAFVPADSGLLTRYRALAKPVGHYTLRRLLLSNMLGGRALYRGAASLSSPSAECSPEERRFWSGDCRHTAVSLREQWQSTLGERVRASLMAKTKMRYDRLAWHEYRNGWGRPDQREKFQQAWLGAVHSLSHRLRTARTRKLFLALLTDEVFSLAEADGPDPDVLRALLGLPRGWQAVKDVMGLWLGAYAHLETPTWEAD